MKRDDANLGRLLLALAITGLGGGALAASNFTGLLQLVPAWFPARALSADIVGALLVVGALGMVMARHQRAGARLVGAILAIALVALDLPLVAAHLRSGNAWTLLGETLALGSGVALIALPAFARLARVGYAITLPVFAALHYFFHDYVAMVIPRWIPAHSFFAYATGAALLLAGLAILSGIQARLAALLTAVMFGLWFAILHIPRLAANPSSDEWASMCICLGMAGCALLVRPRR